MSLNQLTENYTDSEEEGESKIKKFSYSPDDEMSSAVIKNSAKNSPATSDSQVSHSSTPKKGLGGLVSYANEDEEDEDDLSLNKYKLDESDDNLNSEPMDTDEGENDYVEVREEKKSNVREDSIKLPSAPPGKCSTKLQEKVSHFLNRKRSGNTDWNLKIQNNKAFRNPSIYEKLIDHLGLDEMGSNYPLHMFDPHCWGKESFFDQLAKVQSEEMERRKKERREKTKVDIVSGTKKPTEEEAKKRKSRFDQGIANIPMVKSGSSVSVLPPPTFTSVPTSHKTTISAFGALTKMKPTL